MKLIFTTLLILWASLSFSQTERFVIDSTHIVPTRYSQLIIDKDTINFTAPGFPSFLVRLINDMTQVQLLKWEEFKSSTTPTKDFPHHIVVLGNGFDRGYVEAPYSITIHGIEKSVTTQCKPLALFIYNCLVKE